MVPDPCMLIGLIAPLVYPAFVVDPQRLERLPTAALAREPYDRHQVAIPTGPGSDAAPESGRHVASSSPSAAGHEPAVRVSRLRGAHPQISDFNSVMA